MITTNKVRFTVLIPPGKWERLKAAAEVSEVTISEFIRRSLDEALEAQAGSESSSAAIKVRTQITKKDKESQLRLEVIEAAKSMGGPFTTPQLNAKLGRENDIRSKADVWYALKDLVNEGLIIYVQQELTMPHDVFAWNAGQDAGQDAGRID